MGAIIVAMDFILLVGEFSFIDDTPIKRMILYQSNLWGNFSQKKKSLEKQYFMNFGEYVVIEHAYTNIAKLLGFLIAFIIH